MNVTKYMNCSISRDVPVVRRKSTISQKCFTVRKVLCYSLYVNFVLASIVNRLNYVEADEAAVKVLLGSDYGAKSLGQSSRSLESGVKRYFLRNCRISESDRVK